MRTPSPRSALARAASLSLLLGTACEMIDFGHTKDDVDFDAESLRATLSGQNEIPPAAANGRGSALLALNANEGTLCFDLAVEKLEPVTAAHVHRAPAGVNGPIVVDFEVMTSVPKHCKDRQMVSAIRAGDGAAGDAFGSVLAVEDDTAIVGAAGAAYVFERTEAAWSEQQKLSAPEPGFGSAVALSGATAAVGAAGGAIIGAATAPRPYYRRHRHYYY